MVKKTVKPEVVLAPGTGLNTSTRPRRGLLIAVDARVIQILRGGGAGLRPRENDPQHLMQFGPPDTIDVFPHTELCCEIAAYFYTFCLLD